MSDWGRMRHRKGISHLGQLLLSLAFSVPHRSRDDQGRNQKGVLLLRNSVSANTCGGHGHVCVYLDDRNWAS